MKKEIRESIGWAEDQAKKLWDQTRNSFQESEPEIENRHLRALRQRYESLDRRHQQMDRKLEQGLEDIHRVVRRQRAQARVPLLKGLALVGLGAGLVYFLDEKSGRRRRALLRDQARGLINDLNTSVEIGSKDLMNRAQGYWAGVASMPKQWTSGPAPDAILVERVRSKLGHYVSHPRSIEVAVLEGVVTLTGPILAWEVDPLLRAVAYIPGVKDVENLLEVHQEPGDVPGLQGGAMASMAPAEPEASEPWTPASRLMGSLAGSMLIMTGLYRRGPLGVVAGLLGSSVLARAVTNQSVQSLLPIEFGGTPPGSRSLDRMEDGPESPDPWVDPVGHTPVYPASGPMPAGPAPVVTPAEFVRSSGSSQEPGTMP